MNWLNSFHPNNGLLWGKSSQKEIQIILNNITYFKLCQNAVIWMVDITRTLLKLLKARTSYIINDDSIYNFQFSLGVMQSGREKQRR